MSEKQLVQQLDLACKHSVVVPIEGLFAAYKSLGAITCPKCGQYTNIIQADTPYWDIPLEDVPGKKDPRQSEMFPNSHPTKLESGNDWD